jgi:hypothetical protein
MSVSAIVTSRTAVVGMDERVRATGPTKHTPTLTEPTMGLDAAAGFAASFEGLGVEALAAMLAQDVAQGQQKAARDEERAKAREEHAALDRQVAALHEKADAQRKEAMTSAAFGIAGAGLSMTGAATSSPGWSRGFEAAGKGLSQTADPLGRWAYGGRVTDRDAAATQAASDAKEASAARDDAAARRKAAEEAVDKAQSALLEFVQERAAAKRAIFRAG